MVQRVCSVSITASSKILQIISDCVFNLAGVVSQEFKKKNCKFSCKPLFHGKDYIFFLRHTFPYLQKHLPGFTHKSQKPRSTLLEKLAWRTAPVVMLLLLLSFHGILFANYIISCCNISTPCERQEEMAYAYPSPSSLLITDMTIKNS